MTQIWALPSRLEKQPTDLRRHHHYMRDGTLVFTGLKRTQLSVCPARPEGLGELVDALPGDRYSDNYNGPPASGGLDFESSADL